VVLVPLYAVGQYVAGVLQGIQVPGTNQTLTAQVTPPAVQTLNGPMAFVWGGQADVSRRAGPRGGPGAAGFKKLAWDVWVWVDYLTNANADTADTAFPQLLDAIMATVWAVPATITIDASGNVITPPSSNPNVSQLLNVGEQFRLDYATPRTPQTLKMLYYQARFTLQVDEEVQA
jgi:hypothetical protein